MTGIWVIVAILAGLVLLVTAFNTFWRIVEAVHPFTYRQVFPREIHGHVCDMFNRGLNRSKMMITCEQSGRQLLFRKTYNRGQPGMAFHLTVPVAPSMEPELSQAIAAIGILKLPWNLRRRWGAVSALDVDCLGSVDKAYEAADVVLAVLCCASEPSTFSVRVKGRFLGVDGHVGGETTVREINAMLRGARIVGQWASPRMVGAPTLLVWARLERLGADVA